MYHPIPTQPDCVSAWREAVRVVDNCSDHSAYNVIVDVEDPTAASSLDNPRVAVVNGFLEERERSVEAVANTIFPWGLYARHGAPEFFDIFRERVLKKVRRNERWSGYYFERMTNVPNPGGSVTNQIWEIVERIRDSKTKALNKFEVTIFDPARDVDDSPYGGQCLSYGSFKLISGATKTLTLTAVYRNHYYVEKLLGNLIGLGRLMKFIGQEANVRVGPLTVVSTHAVIDQPAQSKRSDILKMLEKFDQLAMADDASKKPPSSNCAGSTLFSMP